MRSEYALVLLAIASSIAPAVAQAPTTRDSAGVQIVENPARAQAAVAFQLSEKPVYDVGGRKANRDDELNTISAAALQQIRLSDGRRVVGDRARLRFFDSTGKQLRVIGGPDDRPGQFQGISTICRTHGDTLVVYDRNNWRAAVFDGLGQFVREIPLGQRTYVPYSGCFDDGTILTFTQNVPPGPTVVTRRRLDGTALDTIGTFVPPPLGFFVAASQTFAAVGNEVYVGDARASEVRVYNSHGALTRVIRTADSADKTTAIEQLAMHPRGAPGSSDTATQRLVTEQFNQQLRTEARPEEWPAYGHMMVDPAGRVWVQDYQKKSTGVPDVWTSFDASGKLLGKVTIPAWNKRGDPIIRSFTSDGVVVQHNGEDGMLHLYTYKLVPVTTGTP